MVILTENQVVLGKTASFVGIIQATVWFIMCLLCIIEYNIDVSPNQADTLLRRFNKYTYNWLLDNSDDNVVLTPLIFTILMWIFIVLVTMWFVASAFQINVLRKRSINVPVVFKDWSIITVLICVLDLVLVIFIGVDYNSCINGADENFCASTRLPVLVIASRGFILWFVNLYLAWRLLDNAKILRKGNSSAYKGTFGGIIPVYRTVNPIPRVQISSAPSLYSQQLEAVSDDRSFWNVNLRTAMAIRTPPVSPTSPQMKYQHQFFRQ